MHNSGGGSITITEDTHVMGPEGEIIATLSPTENGFRVSFDYEPVSMKVNGEEYALVTSDGHGGQIEHCLNDLEITLKS